MVVHGELRVLVSKSIRTEGVPCLRQRIWVLSVCVRFDGTRHPGNGTAESLLVPEVEL